jgi:hypothetical protein
MAASCQCRGGVEGVEEQRSFAISSCGPSDPWRAIRMVRPIRLFSCPGATPTFPQRDTGGSDRPEEAEWARVYGNSIWTGLPARSSAERSSYLDVDMDGGYRIDMLVKREVVVEVKVVAKLESSVGGDQRCPPTPPTPPCHGVDVLTPTSGRRTPTSTLRIRYLLPLSSLRHVSDRPQGHPGPRVRDTVSGRPGRSADLPAQAMAILAKPRGSRLAPPTRTPSTWSAARRSVALSGFTDPPYRMGTASAASAMRSRSRARKRP